MKLKKCDGECGRDAVVEFHKFNFCEQCAEEILGSNGPYPRPNMEDVIALPDCHQCGERPGVKMHQNRWYCALCFNAVPEWELQNGEEL